MLTKRYGITYRGVSVGPVGPYVSALHKAILGTQTSSLIQYLPMQEAVGLTAIDYSLGNNAVYSGVTLGEEGIGDGYTCPAFDGFNDYVDLWSAGLVADWNRDAGTVMVFVKFEGDWTDTNSRTFLTLAAVNTNDNVITISKITGAGGTVRISYQGNNVISRRDKTDMLATSGSNWFQVALTFDFAADTVKTFVNGIQTGADLNTIGQFTANPLEDDNCNLGVNLKSTLVNPFLGKLAHAAIWSVALTEAEILAIYTASGL